MNPRRRVWMVLLLATLAQACAPTEDGGSTRTTDDTAPGGDADAAAATSRPRDDGGGAPVGGPQSPIAGIAPAQVALVAGASTDGPAWHRALGALFFAAPLGEGALHRMDATGRAVVVRQGSAPIGNAVLANGDLITVEAKRIVRTVVSGNAGAATPTVVATTYPGHTEQKPFDSLKGVAARRDGTLYVTDPGYFAMPGANRVYRVSPSGEVGVVSQFADLPRPSGIALSPDEKTLYVGFAQPTVGTMPFVRRQAVDADGSLGPAELFVSIPPADSSPDGLAVDAAGNLYVAAKAGIEVFRSDRTKIGVVPIPETATGLAFGGADMKTLYVTTTGTRLWHVRLNVAGL